MLRDVISSIPAVIAGLSDDRSQWVCLGLVDSADEVDVVREALGERCDVIAEPFEEDIAIAGGHPWIRAPRTWEVWARLA